MKTHLGNLWRGASLAIALALSLIALSPAHSAPAPAAAPASELGQPAGSIAIPTGVSASAVKTAIVTALAGRQWTVVSQSDERVVGHLKHRSNEATVTFIIGSSAVEMHCVGWQIDKKTGVHEKPELPDRWLKNLKNDIPKFLARGTAK